MPKVTIAVLSWNRLHYLRATLESARRCILYPNLEWIVSDNESDEPGLKESLRQMSWIDRLFFKKQSHADAMNEIVAEAAGEYLILWPEDVQFIVEGDWLTEMVSVMQAHPEIGSVTLDALRQTTLDRLMKPIGWQDVPRLASEAYWRRRFPKRSRTVKSSAGHSFCLCDGRQCGICPSGIPSLTRTATWRQLGPWRTSKAAAANIIDSSMGAEDYMLHAFFLSRLPLQAAIPWMPVAADIVTDPLGCKAKVRKGRRYGVYMPSQSPDGLYYRIHEQADLQRRATKPLSFSDVVEPIGFSIPKDANGDRKKFPINDSIVYDIQAQKYLDYPLIY